MSKHRLFVAAVMFGLTCAGIARAEEAIEEQLIDAMHKVFGVHPVRARSLIYRIGGADFVARRQIVRRCFHRQSMHPHDLIPRQLIREAPMGSG
jgi:hypothetical protein